MPEPEEGTQPQSVQDTFVPEPEGVVIDSWVEGLEVPWSLVFLPDGRALVSERPGRIRLIENGILRDQPYIRFDVASGSKADPLSRFLALFASGEGGLLGLTVHPDFPREPFIYVVQTVQDDDEVYNRIVRLRDEGAHGRIDKVIFDGIPGWVFHNGGRIAFGPDGMLYATTGEIFEAELAQDLDSAGGKILRLTPAGTVPADNPFEGSPVFSFGHRNPQGLAWHPETGELFVSEHGPSGEFGLTAFDEVNVVRAGGNYGWPRLVGADASGRYVDPLIAWPDRTVPPAGMTFVDGTLFLAVLGDGALLRIDIEQTGTDYAVQRIEHWFADAAGQSRLGRLRDVVSGPDGALYILTSNRDGRGDPRPGDDHIYRMRLESADSTGIATSFRRRKGIVHGGS